MCYNTRQTRKKADLEKWLNVEAAVHKSQESLELIHANASGWAHPILWMIPQEYPNKMLPSMWGILPENQKAIRL